MYLVICSSYGLNYELITYLIKNGMKESRKVKMKYVWDKS